MRLLLQGINDKILRENFKIIESAFNNDAILKGQWKHFVITVEDQVTNLRLSHTLGFKPMDFLTTYVSDQESVIWNYAECTDEFLDITTSGACTVRAFIGRYGESR
jgi:hypothetical protein